MNKKKEKNEFSQELTYFINGARKTINCKPNPSFIDIASIVELVSDAIIGDSYYKPYATRVSILSCILTTLTDYKESTKIEDIFYLSVGKNSLLNLLIDFYSDYYYLIEDSVEEKVKYGISVSKTLGDFVANIGDFTLENITETFSDTILANKE